MLRLWVFQLTGEIPLQTRCRSSGEGIADAIRGCGHAGGQLTALQKPLCRGSEGILSCFERRERDDDEGAIARDEL
jgi:hypothetical protein